MELQVEEVGLREGLQNLSHNISLEKKISFVEKAIECGIKRIQLGSFVNPKKLPQLSDTDDLCKHFVGSYQDIIFTGLVLNEKGLTRAVESGLKHLNISISASRTHQKKNTGMEFDRAMQEIETLVLSAKKMGISVRGGIQAAFGCHYEGKVDIKIVKELVSMFDNAGADEIGLSDTSGFATPPSVKEMLKTVRSIAPAKPIALHLHDTAGLGLANALCGMDLDVEIFDSSMCGLGGCPFMEGAAGNIPTEDLVFMFKSFGCLGKISMDNIVGFSRWTEKTFGVVSRSKIIHVYQKMKELDLL